MLLKITIKQSERLRRFLSTRWSPKNSAEVLQIFEDESVNNFTNVWRTHQGVWAPLTKRYAAWKNRHHPGKKKWELTGGTIQSLTTRARIDAMGGYVQHKHVYLDHSRHGVVKATYEIKSPAAGGYFERNNRRRELWKLLPDSRAKVESGIYEYLRSLIKRG